jgi:DNA-binding MarR family transcriptional regulator/GNAT superfamily N-acetyltransferase
MAQQADASIAAIRRFNRTVTQRLGVLNDHYLSRDRSLGEARMLWEIGEQGCEVRSLRTRLGLDSGYVSRLLGNLESATMVTVSASDTDRRVRVARLTRRGLAERRLLDTRSNDLASSFLEPLSDDQRARLLGAMAEVERLLTAGLVTIDVVDPDTDAARFCLGAYFAELQDRFDTGFDPAASLPADGDHLRLPHGLFVLASLRSEPVGCGAMIFTDGEPAYLKRMWVSPSARGLGVGRRLLAELETLALVHGAPGTRLETNRALVEAIRLYRSAGYEETEPFNDEPYAHHWFVKRAQPASSSTRSRIASR